MPMSLERFHKSCIRFRLPDGGVGSPWKARIRRVGATLLLGALAGCAHLDLEVPPDPAWPEVTLQPEDRILILAAHPDDEILATAGVIHEAVERDLPVQVVFYTYGDNNVWSFTRYKKRPILSASANRCNG